MATIFYLPFADVGSGIKPSDGAKLFFYETGTDTPKDTFTTSAGGVANSNPVIALATGVFPSIYLTGKYWATLKDKNDVQIWAGVAVESFGSEALTTTELIASTNNFDSNVIVNTTGYASSGFGNASWKQNGVTGQTVSQTPLQLNGKLLNDGNGDQWATVQNDTIPSDLGAIDAAIPTGRGAFAPAFVTSLSDEKRNGVTLRHILGKSYSSANDGAATLNTYLAELAGNNIAITDPDNIKVLCLEPIRIVNGMVMDLGYYTRFSRGYSDSSQDNSALFSRASWGTDTSNMRISKGILTAETGETGKMMAFYGDDNQLTQTQMLNYQGGQAMVFGGDHNRLILLRAITTVDSFGDGAFRMVGGDDMKAFGLYADSYDDCLQYVPITGSDNERFNLSISNSQYIGCYGKSRGARSMIVAIAGPQDEFAMTGTIRKVGFTSCTGGGVLRSVNVENTEGDGNVQRQIDDINFTNVHIDGSDEDQVNAQSFQVLGRFDGAIGKVSVNNSTFKNSPRAVGLSASYVKEILLNDVYLSGETNCIETTTAVGIIKVRDSELAIVNNGGGNAADNVLQINDSDISIKDTKIVGIATSKNGLRLNSSGKKATLENLEYVKAAGATTTTGTSHATGSTTVANNVFGDVDDLVFGGGDYKTLRGTAPNVGVGTVQNTSLGALQSATQDINTLNKVAGETRAFDSTNGVQYWATGSAATDAWQNFQTGAQVTPS